MKELRKKSFKNGVVYCLQLEDGFLVETTDTFLPYYTKDAIGCHPRLSRRGRIDITQELNQRGADEGVIMYHLQPRINTTVILNSGTPIEQYGRIKRSNKRKNK